MEEKTQYKIEKQKWLNKIKDKTKGKKKKWTYDWLWKSEFCALEFH